MVTHHKNLTMMRGDTYIFSVHFNGFNSDRKIEFMYFTCSSNLLSESIEFWLDLDTGITQSPSEEYTYFVEIHPENTKDMLPGVYYYDLQVTIDGDVFTILEGELNIKADVTPNNSDDFYKVDTPDGEDINDYFQALDVTNSQSFFFIEDTEFIALGKQMSSTYKAKQKYIKNEFVQYNNKLWKAKNNFTAPATFNSSQWTELGDLPNG